MFDDVIMEILGMYLYCASKHWNAHDILMIFSSLTAQEVDILTISDENLSKWKRFRFNENFENLRCIIHVHNKKNITWYFNGTCFYEKF